MRKQVKRLARLLVTTMTGKQVQLVPFGTNEWMQTDKQAWNDSQQGLLSHCGIWHLLPYSFWNPGGI